jgi:hypothetical protein
MPNLADAQKLSNKGLGAHHRTQGSEDYSDGGRLKRYAGYVTGYAETFAGALNVGHEAIIEAASDIETFMYIDGRRGTDNPGGSTNRTRSEDYPDREGVDKVFIALTLEQFERLGDEVGAAVEV